MLPGFLTAARISEFVARVNLNFKVRIKNSMRGWSLRNPPLSKRAMCHVVNMETLHVGLLMHKVSSGEGVALVACNKRQR